MIKEQLKYLTFKMSDIQHIPLCCGIVDNKGNILVPERRRG